MQEIISVVSNINAIYAFMNMVRKGYIYIKKKKVFPFVKNKVLIELKGEIKIGCFCMCLDFKINPVLLS